MENMTKKLSDTYAKFGTAFYNLSEQSWISDVYLFFVGLFFGLAVAQLPEIPQQTYEQWLVTAWFIFSPMVGFATVGAGFAIVGLGIRFLKRIQERSTPLQTSPLSTDS